MKSWGFARALLLLGVQRPLRVLCVRELQASLDDSVHKLLSDQIVELGLSGSYRVEKATIYGPNGTEFNFEGIRHNVQKIKSYEGIDVCWVEEAQGVSKNSWEVLIPTIRKAGSEIWISFNPLREKDNTYQRFVINTPPNCVLMPVNWRDNPWLTAELLAEIEHSRQTDPDTYLNVWEGHCVSNLEGAIYAQELREAKLAGRITEVPWERSVGVGVFFDLGRRDMTAMWFIQRVAMQTRVLEYVEDRGKDFSAYIRLLQRKPYVYDLIGLPHDGASKVLGTKLSIEEQLRAQKFKVKVAKKLPLVVGISAVRSAFPQLWFDKKLCAKGLERLEEYRYDVDDDPDDGKQFSINPVHNEASHGADALRTYAVLQRKDDMKTLEGDTTQRRERRSLRGRFAGFMRGETAGWMGR